MSHFAVDTKKAAVNTCPLFELSSILELDCSKTPGSMVLAPKMFQVRKMISLNYSIKLEQ